MPLVLPFPDLDPALVSVRLFGLELRRDAPAHAAPATAPWAVAFPDEGGGGPRALSCA